MVAPSNSLAACDAELFEELVVERRYLGRPVFVISDPDGIKRVLLDNFDNYTGLPPVRRMFGRLLGAGLLALEGEDWRRHRRLLNATLDARSIVADMAATASLTEHAALRLAAVPKGEPFKIGPPMQSLLAESVRHVFAGDDPDDGVGKTINAISHLPGRFHLRDFLPGLPRLDRWQSRGAFPILDRLIAERRDPAHGGGSDLVRRMVEARDRRTGARLDDGEVYDEIVSLAHGSTMTTLRALTWFWYLLALHPSAESTLHAELDEVLGGRAPAATDFARLRYLGRAIDEAMRLYPPIPIMLRLAVADDELCGRRVPRGAIVAVLPWVLHRHRKLWDEPERFDPDRFLAERSVSRHRYAYLPFSAGPRVCIGESLAAMQTRVVAAILAQRFRFRVVPGQAIEPTGGVVTLRPRQGIWMTAEPRNVTRPPLS
ncbi:MAG TPA: cytochrome P450 [Stellaceae bacterium]|jgi:cytochrome P450